MEFARKYGYVADPKHAEALAKDKHYASRIHAVGVEELPKCSNNISTAPAVVNQYSLGSCVGNATGAALKHAQIIQKLPDVFFPSRLFIYYNARMTEGTTSEDNGCCIRNAMKVVAHLGAPPEELWPYDLDKWDKCPAKGAYWEARKHLAVDYYRVNWSELDEIKQCLAGGHGIVFGFQVPEHFESKEVERSGVLHMPGKNEKFRGGHAVYCLDYHDEAIFPSWSKPGGVLVQNSWGEEWGVGGRFWMPYDYITSPTLSDDFWTIRTVEA